MAKSKKEVRSAKREKKTVNIGFLMPVMVILGLIIGFTVCWLTFSYLGGN